MEKYHKAIKIFNIVGAFIILILLLLLIFPNNPISKYIETSRLGYDKEICWNNSGDGQNWPNGRGGGKDDGSIVTQALVPLSESAKVQYANWIKAGKPIAKGCE